MLRQQHPEIQTGYRIKSGMTNNIPLVLNDKNEEIYFLRNHQTWYHNTRIKERLC